MELTRLVRDRDLEVTHVVEQVADAVVVRIVGHIFSVEGIGRSALRFVHIAPAVVVVVGIDRVRQAVVVEVRVLVEHGDGQVDRRIVQVVGGVDGVHREVETSVGVPVMRPSLSMLRPSGKSGVTSHERTSAPNCSTSKGAIVALTGRSNSVSVSTR